MRWSQQRPKKWGILLNNKKETKSFLPEHTKAYFLFMFSLKTFLDFLFSHFTVNRRHPIDRQRHHGSGGGANYFLLSAFRFGFPSPDRLPARLPKVFLLLALALLRPPPPAPPGPPRPPCWPPPPPPWPRPPPLFSSVRFRDLACTSSFTMSITSSGMRRYLIVLPRM